MTSPSPALPRLDVGSPQGNGIVDAATRCFDAWGVERTRMGDIAAEAGISRPTLYRYFPTKEALILEVMLRHIRVANDKIRMRLELTGPGRDVILRCLMLLIQESAPKEQQGSLLRTEPMTKLARRSATSAEVLDANSELWAEVLDYARSRGELRDGIDLSETVRWLTFIVHVNLVIPELVPDEGRLAEYLDAFVVGAIVQPPGARSPGGRVRPSRRR
jgi:AcrR family transcriptional regulator